MSKRGSSTEFRQEIALRLKEAILKSGLTKAEAAQKLGVTRQTLWLYLAAKCAPGSEVLKRACQEWKLSLTVKGVTFTPDAFGAPQDRITTKQLDLLEALDQIRPDQIQTQFVGRIGPFYELRLRIKVAS